VRGIGLAGVIPLRSTGCVRTPKLAEKVATERHGSEPGQQALYGCRVKSTHISYSLYLARGFVQFLTTELLVSAGFQNTKSLSYASSPWLLLAMLGATLLMAAFIHREVEIVGRTGLRKLLSAWRETSNVTPWAKQVAGAAASMPKMN
jgi:hypothetical protein